MRGPDGGKEMIRTGQLTVACNWGGGRRAISLIGNPGPVAYWCQDM